MDTNSTTNNYNQPSYVTLPAEDFRELNSAANEYTPYTASDRLGQSLQTAAAGAVFVGAVVAVGTAYAKITDWLEERAFQRKTREIELKKAAAKEDSTTTS